MHQKKLLEKTWRKYALFLLLLMFVKLVLLITLVHFLTTFSTDSKSAWNSAFFDTFFDFFQKNVLGHISIFSKFEAKRAKNGSKYQKTYLVNVS
jgi:hypothetical protein